MTKAAIILCGFCAVSSIFTPPFRAIDSISRFSFARHDTNNEERSAWELCALLEKECYYRSDSHLFKEFIAIREVIFVSIDHGSVEAWNDNYLCVCGDSNGTGLERDKYQDLDVNGFFGSC
jgi:hypothetical protein